MIVIDTNVLTYLLLPGPKNEQAEILRQHERRWTAPPLWRSEFRNVLTGYIRRELLQLSQAVALMEEAEMILSALEQRVSSEHVLQLVSSSRCSSYDCEFVAAAQQLGVLLITEDRAILAAFPELAQTLQQATS
ncbi:MAG: type II toxin-antitoxin system VapC family toxin [Cyanobacteriota bacterium]